MCERRDAILAVSAAADRLTDACEAVLHGPLKVAEPEKVAIAKVVHVAFRELSVTPPDIAIQLAKLG